MGLVTIEDIIEEIIGDFTTQAPDGTDTYRRGADGSVVVDGLAPLRTLNRKLGTQFPVDGPKTLNGLIVDHLGDIPDAGTRVEISGQTLEILQTQDRGVKVVRLLAPVGREAVRAFTKRRTGRHHRPDKLMPPDKFHALGIMRRRQIVADTARELLAARDASLPKCQQARFDAPSPWPRTPHPLAISAASRARSPSTG